MPSSGTHVLPSLDRRVAETIRTQGLIERGQKVLVAVSGGPDSVALLLLLHRLAEAWRLSLTVVHCHYGLRGSESDGDARFVRDLCVRLSVPFILRHLDTTRRPGMSSSLQSRARDQRYRLFKDLAGEIGADRVALGHTADDQAETVLLRMLRGAGLRGLAGMPRVREHMFVRPLLNRTRQDLLRYLESQGQAYRVDSSNAKSLYARNRVRHEVLPGLKRMLPGAVQILARQAQILREDDAVLEGLVADLWPRVLEAETVDRLLFNRRALRDQPLALQRRLLRLAIGRLHPARPTPPFHLVDTILIYLATSRAGASWQWEGLAIRCEQTTLGLCLDSANRAQGSRGAPRPAPESLIVDCLPWTGCWPATGEVISMRSLSRDEGEALLHHGTPDSALLDGERCSMPLTVRAWRTGDWFCPIGMKGRRKKLQDYFTDAKLSRSLRGRVPLIVSAAGIVWVAGYRVDQRFCATRLSSQFLHISLKRSQ